MNSREPLISPKRLPAGRNDTVHTPLGRLAKIHDASLCFRPPLCRGPFHHSIMERRAGSVGRPIYDGGAGFQCASRWPEFQISTRRTGSQFPSRQIGCQFMSRRTRFQFASRRTGFQYASKRTRSPYASRRTRSPYASRRRFQYASRRTGLQYGSRRRKPLTCRTLSQCGLPPRKRARCIRRSTSPTGQNVPAALPRGTGLLCREQRAARNV